MNSPSRKSSLSPSITKKSAIFHDNTVETLPIGKGVTRIPMKNKRTDLIEFIKASSDQIDVHSDAE